MARTEPSLSRHPSSAVHCVIVDKGAVQLVATHGIVMIDLQDRQVGVDGHARYHHASVAMHLTDARVLLAQLTDAIAEASAGRAAQTPETARWGRHPRRAGTS